MHTQNLRAFALMCNIYTFILTYIHTDTYNIHIYTYINTYIHTHTQSLPAFVHTWQYTLPRPSRMSVHVRWHETPVWHMHACIHPYPARMHLHYHYAYHHFSHAQHRFFRYYYYYYYLCLGCFVCNQCCAYWPRPCL